MTRHHRRLIGVIVCVALLLSIRTRLEESNHVDRSHFLLNFATGEVKEDPTGAIKILERNSESMALIKVSMDSHRRCLVRVFYRYEGEPEGWSLNIGDSRTNNGYSGDGATQTNDSELQILGSTLSVWGSDLMEDKSGRCLENVPNFVSAGNVAEFVISNERVEWRSPRQAGELASPYIFALADQPEIEGKPNRDIFVGLNRVVQGSRRSGSGVEAVEVELQ